MLLEGHNLMCGPQLMRIAFILCFYLLFLSSDASQQYVYTPEVRIGYVATSDPTYAAWDNDIFEGLIYWSKFVKSLPYH